MPDDLTALEAHIGELMARLEPGERRSLASKIGINLRRATVHQIRGQTDPDGAGFVPRKPREALRDRRGSIRRRAKSGPMFRRLGRAGALKVEPTPEEVSIGYAQAIAARVAGVHQFGLRDRVTRTGRSPEVTYPERRLLGFNDERAARILDLVLEHLEK